MSDRAESQNDPQAEPGVVLVTGAGHRIGRAISLALADDGWAVAVHHHRSTDDAKGLVKLIQQRRGRAVAVAAPNVSSPATPTYAAVIGPTANGIIRLPAAMPTSSTA